MAVSKNFRSIAVVVTVKNDAAGLARLLASLERQVKLPNEVIIAVADSTDNTLSVAQSFSFPKKVKYQVLAVDGANRSQGRNRAVKASQADIIAFADAGCIADQNWLAELCKPICDGQSVFVSGFTWGESVHKISPFAEAQLPYVLVPLQHIPAHPHPATRNMAMTRQLFDKIGGFRSELNWAEDHELARRVAKLGFKSTFVPPAKVFWTPRRNILSYAAMVFRLTQHDIVASNWRFGQLSMLVRYGFLFLWLILWWIIAGWQTSIWSSISLLLAYLLFKVSRFHYERWPTYVWSILLQLTTDVAVILGIKCGFIKRLLTLRKHK